ncbi:MAG: hypothetical protein ACYDC0_14970 [Acidimicrobiales bacterium]
MTARYVPAGNGPVGGDWSDAFELPGGRLGLVMGDVGGHGVEAALAEPMSSLLANDST